MASPNNAPTRASNPQFTRETKEFTLPKAVPPFRNEHGRRMPKQLFYETWTYVPTESRTVSPAFTFNRDIEGCTNLGRLYVSLEDPTGYKLSQSAFGGDYSFWLFLLEWNPFKDALVTWNKELDAKLASEGLDKIKEIAKGDTAGALVASKFLANKEYKDKQKARQANGRGRPSKEEVEGELKQMAHYTREINEDANRIRIIK